MVETDDMIKIGIVIVIFVLFFLCLLQIIWIRGKLGNYADSKLANGLLSSSSSSSASSSSLSVYSLIVNAKLSLILNNVTSLENSMIVPLTIPTTFNVPYTCNGAIVSTNMLSNIASYLVINLGSSADKLIIDILQGRITYIMINGAMYLVHYSQDIQMALQGQNNALVNTYILYLFTMKSSNNVAETLDSTCTIDMLPFFGQISQDTNPNLINSIGLNKSSSDIPVHALGFILQV